MPPSGYIIEQRGGVPSWYSISAGRDIASPHGGWTNDLSKTLQFAREKDATEFMNAFIPTQAPQCRVVPLPEGIL